jgi:hypothetical protein
MRRLALLLGVLTLAATAGASTFLFLDSHPGDAIADGERFFYGSATGAFQVSGDYRAVTFYFSCGSDACGSELWSLTFVAPVGHLLEPGVYDDAEGLQPTPSARPQLGVYGYPPTRTCASLRGRFVVHDATYTSDIDVAAFCGGFRADVRRRRGFALRCRALPDG